MSELYFEDKGTTGETGSWTGDSNFDITTDATGTLLKLKTGKTSGNRTPSPTSSFQIGHDNELGTDVGFGISMKILDITTAYIQFTNVGGIKKIPLNKTGKHVVTITPTGIYLDGTLQPNTTPTSNTSQVSLYLEGNNSIKYHELQVYKITEKRFHYANTLHNVRFYDKEDITGNNNKPGLLKDKQTIHINMNQIDDLTFPETATPKEHTHGNITNDGKIKENGTFQISKNLVTDANGKITTETKQSDIVANTNKNKIQPVSITIGAQSAGSANEVTYAKADHIHTLDTSFMNAPLNNKADKNHEHGLISKSGTININGQLQKNMNVVTNGEGQLTVDNWTNIPKANTNNSKITMNGNSASAGGVNETTYAKADHVHPHDSSKANTVHQHVVLDITDFPTKMDPKPHDHGNITNAGVIPNQFNMNVITNNSGQITTETRIAPSRITDIEKRLNMFQWLGKTDQILHRILPASFLNNGNLTRFMVNPGMLLAFIEIEYPTASYKGAPLYNQWLSTGITIPNEVGPIYTQYITPQHKNQLVALMDDDDPNYPGDIRYYFSPASDKKYNNKGVKDSNNALSTEANKANDYVKANGFYRITGTYLSAFDEELNP